MPRVTTLSSHLKALGLLTTGRGRARSLLQLCHAGRLVGGLSVSLAATPDEAVGPLTHLMGGLAKSLRVLDVRGQRPMELEVQFDAPADVLRDDEGPRRRVERWELEDVAGLAHNLNDLCRDERDVKLVAVLGDWEDMLQLWALERKALRALLEDGTLRGVRNERALGSILEG